MRARTTIFLKTLILGLLIPGLVFSQQNKLDLAEKYLILGQADSAKMLLQALSTDAKSAEDIRQACLLALAEARTNGLTEANERIKAAENAQQQLLSNNTLLRAEIMTVASELELLQGNTERAIENCAEAESHLSQLKLDRSLLAANVLTNKGLAYWSTGAVEQALEYFNQALRIRQEQSVTWREVLVASSQNNLGLVYLADEPMKALGYYETALAAYQNALGEFHPLCAIAHTNIALANLQAKDSKAAIANSQKALDIRLRTLGNKHPNTGFSYISLAQIYQQENDYSAAEANYLRAQNIYKSVYPTQHPEMTNLYNSMAGFEFKRGNIKNALKHTYSAEKANERPSEPEEEKTPVLYFNNFSLLTTYLYRAKILVAQYENKTLKLNDLKEALLYTNLADSLLVKIRFSRSNKADQLALGLLAKDIYEVATAVCLLIADNVPQTKKYQKMAFYYAERSKAAVLLAAIAETQAKSFAGIPEDVLGQERELKSSIAILEKKLNEKHSKDLENQLKEELFRRNRSYESFVKKLEKDYPDYYDLKYNIQTVSAEEVQAILPPGKGLVSYFFNNTKKRVYVFLITQKGFKVRDVPIREGCELALAGIRNALEYQAVEIFSKSSSMLYKLLIEPLGNIKTIKHLVFVPEGRLGTIPFETFVKKPFKKANDVRYLIESHAISYTFSATLFVKENLTNAPQSPAKSKALLFAPIVFKSAKNADASYKRMADLPATEQEIKEIKALLDKNQIEAQLLTQENAQEAAFKAQDLQKFDYLHLATHGLVNESRPELSQVFMAANTSPHEDGHLYAAEIYNLKLQARLVSLSACQTGLGKIAQGEGIIGLTRAFLYAGAQRVLVSLWSVADESTARLMIAFYGYLLSGNNEAEALQKAKIDMLNFYRSKGSEGLDAFYWSPFIVVGR